MATIFLLIGAGLAAFIEFGHAVFGRKWYLEPALADISKDEARVALHFVWYLADLAFLTVIVVAVLTAFAGEAGDVVRLGWIAGVFYGVLGIVHLRLGLGSGIDGAPKKLFQWIFFFAASGAFLLAAVM